MKKEDFIKWVEEKSDFEYFTLDSFRREIDYSSYTYDYLYLDEEEVILTYEEKYCGGYDIINRIFTYEDFIKSFENDFLYY